MSGVGGAAGGGRRGTLSCVALEQLVSSASLANVPDLIGRFRIRRQLGAGGMAVVYLAEDPALDSLVAIKLLQDPSEDLRERFALEARNLARLRGKPHIVTVFEVDEFDGQPFFAMEYIAGETLQEMIRRKAVISVARKLELMEEVCIGLGHAHRAGLIHRDIKPANIIVDTEGTLKILDFGIARFADSSMTLAGTLMGTLNYMSPEQAAGETLDKRSDIFGVGAIFYELLAFRKPFSDDTEFLSINEVLLRTLHRDPAPLENAVPGLDREVIRIVNRALEKSVIRRYQDLSQMQRDIGRVRQRLEMDEPALRTIIISRDETVVLPRGDKPIRRSTSTSCWRT